MNYELRIKNLSRDFFVNYSVSKLEIGNWNLEIPERRDGQAIIMLLFFIVIALLVTSAAIVLMFSNSIAATGIQQGDVAYYTAESGAENALIQLLRNPSYKGETLPVNGGNATVQVTGISPVTITSDGNVGKFKRTVQVTATYTNNILTVTSWKEIY